MKTLTLLFLILSPGIAQVGGCTDSLAYSCEMDTVWTNYIFDIGGTKYDNSCNWDWDLANNVQVYVGGCETGICQELLYWEDTDDGEGYYNPEAEEDDGSCRYYQAPHGDEVSITITDDGIVLDWSAFELPELSDLQYFCVLRCTGEGCLFLPGFQIPDANNGQETVDTSPWEFDVEIKYAIGVKYSSNPYWGWASFENLE